MRNGEKERYIEYRHMRDRKKERKRKTRDTEEREKHIIEREEAYGKDRKVCE